MARPEYTARGQAARAARTGGMRLRSATKRSISAWRAASSGARRIAEGCTVAVTYGAQRAGTHTPRCFVTLNFGPINAWPAVAPTHNSTIGLLTSSAASIHGSLVTLPILMVITLT